MKTTLSLVVASLLSVATYAQNVGIGTNNAQRNLDVVGTLGIRNDAAWDHLWLAHTGDQVVINAGGAESGISFNIGTNASGSYADATYREIMRLLPSGNVGIGTASPEPSALLHLSATNKGFLVPKMTNAQRNTIQSPASGILIFQTNNDAGFYYHTGSAWTKIVSANNMPKVVSGFVDANNMLGKGFTVARLANNQYTISWPSGTFSGFATPDVRSFGGAVAFSSWTAYGDGSGTFTTVANVGATIWFSITELL
jgi:hypothetical protein